MKKNVPRRVGPTARSPTSIPCGGVGRGLLGTRRGLDGTQVHQGPAACLAAQADPAAGARDDGFPQQGGEGPLDDLRAEPRRSRAHVQHPVHLPAPNAGGPPTHDLGGAAGRGAQHDLVHVALRGPENRQFSTPRVAGSQGVERKPAALPGAGAADAGRGPGQEIEPLGALFSPSHRAPSVRTGGRLAPPSPGVTECGQDPVGIGFPGGPRPKRCPADPVRTPQWCCLRGSAGTLVGKSPVPA